MPRVRHIDWEDEYHDSESDAEDRRTEEHNKIIMAEIQSIRDEEDREVLEYDYEEDHAAQMQAWCDEYDSDNPRHYRDYYNIDL